jgi:NADH-quinone oxidoreductase subunit A
MQPTEYVAYYLALFAMVGFLFVFASLLLGRFLRAQAPTTQKLETYECGEPAIGPGTVQFDLRFYVVALLFLIFEVEVALFFPPAVIFGEATQALAKSSASAPGPKANVPAELAADMDQGMLETGEDWPDAEGAVVWSRSSAQRVATAALLDLGLFFAVVLVGFAFVWRRGDLDWVRAVRHPATPAETAVWMSKMRRSGY